MIESVNSKLIKETN